MAKKIDVMEIGMSIARLFRLAFQNYRIIVSSFILGFLLALGYTGSPFMDQETYIANGSISHPSSANLVIQTTIVEAITSNLFAEAVANQLQENEIGLIDETFLSKETIQSSITAAAVTNSLKINISFSYPDETLSVVFLNEIIDQFIIYSNTTFPNLGNGVVLGDYAITSTFDGPNTTLYLAIGSLIGLMIGLFLGVLWDAFKGTLYSAQDLKEIGLSSFSLPLKIKVNFSANSILTWLGIDKRLSWLGLNKSSSFESEQTKLILQGLVASSSFTTIQNNLESTRPQPQDPLTTLLVSPVPNTSIAMIGFAYARQSSTQGRKTLLIDFDLKQVPFTKYLERYQIETKKKPSAKEGVSFLSTEENLDVYLPLLDIIPAKVIRDDATQDIMTQVKKKYDHIIILGPSILPDSSVLSMVQYANSALIIGKAGVTTTNEMIQSVNILIDANLTAIETLMINELTQTQWPNWKDFQSFFKSTPKPTNTAKPKPTKKK
jgi:Mrp family chromosome partitioning ATPase